MHVFRIETDNHCGVCNSSGLCKKYHTVCASPCPDYGFTDELDVATKLFDDGWRFAFPSLDKLKEWFPDEKGRTVMKANTARVVEYDIAETRVTHGIKDSQVLFDYPKAKKVAEFDVVTLAPLVTE